MSQWKPEEETYLRELSTVCAQLSERFRAEYDRYRKLEARFQIPAIIISGIIGLTSFGVNQFGDAAYSINIAMGVVGLGLGVLNSIQTYLRIGSTMSGCLLTASNLTKLKESIDIELALPLEDRASTGVMFVREAASQYERIMDAAPPVLKKVRFIRQAHGERLSYASSASANAAFCAIEVNPVHSAGQP